MSIDIRLKSGLVLREADRMLRAKFEAYEWANYDADAPANDHVTMEAVARANRLGARVPYAVWTRLLSKCGGEIDALLSQLPKTPLEDIDLEAVREPIVALFELVIEKDTSLSRATKILYPFRPSLIPVLDSVVEYYYWYAASICDEPRFRRLQACRWGEYAFELLALVRDDIVAARTEIDAVRANIRGEPYAVASRVRMVESLIWWYYAREGSALPPPANEA